MGCYSPCAALTYVTICIGGFIHILKIQFQPDHVLFLLGYLTSTSSYSIFECHNSNSKPAEAHMKWWQGIRQWLSSHFVNKLQMFQIKRETLILFPYFHFFSSSAFARDIFSHVTCHFIVKGEASFCIISRYSTFAHAPDTSECENSKWYTGGRKKNNKKKTTIKKAKSATSQICF